MKRFLFPLLAVIAFGCLSFKCDVDDEPYCRKSIRFFNDSDRMVYVSWDWAWDYSDFDNGDLTGTVNRVHPEKIIPGDYSLDVIKVGGNHCIDETGIGICIYIFDAAEFEVYDWEYISSNNLYLEYRLVTYDELAKNHIWTITYSGEQ